METMEKPIIGCKWGPVKYGVELIIDQEGVPGGQNAVIDVEDNEKDVFVGVGIMCDPTVVYYYSTLSSNVRARLSNAPIGGHNIKSDARKLRGWEVGVEAENLDFDTMLKSYVQNSTKESHGLKELCKEFIQMEWPSYDAMTKPPVGINTLEEFVEYLRNWTPETAQEPGPKKLYTLDMLPIDLVASYNGCDCIGTWRLNAYFDRVMNAAQRGYYNMIELPMMRLLLRMELKGVTVDVESLKKVQGEFEQASTELMAQLEDYLKRKNVIIPCVKSCPKKEHTHEFKPKSPKQMLQILNQLGIKVEGTAKGDLLPYMGHEFVSMMSECRKVQSMLSKFINAWLEIPTLPKIHTTFSQVSFDDETGEWKGIRTGRLSSKDPNLQQVKKPDEDTEEDYGRVLRSNFIPSSPELELWVYDFDQFQYRILAHCTKEPGLLKAFRNNVDVHEETARILLERTTITKMERKLGKGLNFGAVFGSQPEKIAEIAGCTLEEADKFYKLYWKRLPYVSRWINRTKMLAHVHKSVKTLLGRVIPLPDIDSRNIYDRMHAERQAVNFIIQGSEADIIKLGMLRVDAASFMPILQVHDELHFEGLPKDREEHMPKIKSILENVVKLDVPVIANGGFGSNWYEAK